MPYIHAAESTEGRAGERPEAALGGQSKAWSGWEVPTPRAGFGQPGGTAGSGIELSVFR